MTRQRVLEAARSVATAVEELEAVGAAFGQLVASREPSMSPSLAVLSARRRVAIGTVEDALAELIGAAAATEIMGDLEACAAGKRAKRLRTAARGETND
jgi:hypothetical protein